MTVYELYKKMSGIFPRELSCEWDNDGLMCCPDTSRRVERVLLALDVTEHTVEYAKEKKCDLIISHHPLVFRGLNAVTPDNHVARKVINLLSAGISVFSFHTRADAASGGVNDALAKALGLVDVKAFADGMGRIGYLREARDIGELALFVKNTLGAPTVAYIGEGISHRVAVLGGDGKDCIADAIAAGADTYISGSIGYNATLDAPEMGIKLIEAGHFHTENPVLERFAEAVKEAMPDAQILKYSSYPIKHV